MDFRSLVEHLKASQNVDGLLFLGSTGQSTLNAFSDRDLLIVLNERDPSITNGTVFCDDILVDLVIVTRKQIEDLIITEPGSISLSDSRASFFNWVLSGIIVLDRCGCLVLLRDTLRRNKSMPKLTEGEAVSRSDHTIYNLAQTQRMSGSPDPFYQQAVDLKMLRQLSDLMVDYFNLRGLPWRGEKEAIRHWKSLDPGYIDLFMRCYWERCQAQRVRLYAELVKATIEPIGFRWYTDGPNFVLSPPSDMTRENLPKSAELLAVNGEWITIVKRRGQHGVLLWTYSSYFDEAEVTL